MARPRSETAQQRALDAAVGIIAEHGISGFTVDAVAQRSGVAKTTIYRRWRSGDELLIAALDCTIEPLPTPNTGSLRSDLIELYESVSTMIDQPQVFRTMLGVLSRAASDPEFKRLHGELEYERHQPLRTILQLAQARGELAADAELALIIDIIEGPMVARRLLKLESFEAGELGRIVDLLMVGIVPSQPKESSSTRSGSTADESSSST